MTANIWNKDKDWPTLEGWFRHSGGAPHVSHLPPLGMVVSDDDGPLLALWVYQAVGVGVCFPEWLVSRPGAGPFQKIKGVKLVLERLQHILKLEDYQLMRIAILDPRIARIAERLGFINLGPKVHYLLKETNS